MRSLRKDFDEEGIFRRVANAPQCVLLLDYDGTLAPFHVDPAQARPYPGIVSTLNAIQRTSTRLVIVTGRAIASVAPMLPLEQSVEIWGAHGFEHRVADGTMERATLPDAVQRDLKAVADWKPTLEALGARIEYKPASVAVHWRARSARIVDQIRTTVLSMLERTEKQLIASDFDGGIELCAPGFNKGDVVRRLCAEYDPEALIVYLGDDEADEKVFDVLHDRGAGVLVRAKWRDTRADAWIKPPGEVLRFFERWAAARRARV